MRFASEIEHRGLGRIDQANQDARQDVVAGLNSLDFETPSVTYEETGSSYNKANLSAGAHQRIRITKPFGMVGGLGVKTVSAGQSTINAKAVIDSVHFKNTDKFPNELVIVGTGTANTEVRVVFRNCVFERTAEMQSAIWVRVAPGAKAVFVGCMFSGGFGSGSVIDNQAPNVAAGVQLIGCVNANPTVGLGTVTATGVIS